MKMWACFPVLEGLKYAKSHEWVKSEGSVATIGITDHAQVIFLPMLFLPIFSIRKLLSNVYFNSPFLFLMFSVLHFLFLVFQMYE